MKIFISETSVSGVPQYIYHQTNINNAKEILKTGFEYGAVLGKGENTFGIFFAPTHRGMKNTNYNRGITDKTAMVEVKTAGLNLFDTNSLKKNPLLPSYKQDEYIMRQNIEAKGIFPKGYDGVIIRNQYENNTIYEIILKKEKANNNITGRLLNQRGKVINAVNETMRSD